MITGLVQEIRMKQPALWQTPPASSLNATCFLKCSWTLWALYGLNLQFFRMVISPRLWYSLQRKTTRGSGPPIATRMRN